MRDRRRDKSFMSVRGLLFRTARRSAREVRFAPRRNVTIRAETAVKVKERKREKENLERVRGTDMSNLQRLNEAA